MLSVMQSSLFLEGTRGSRALRYCVTILSDVQAILAETDGNDYLMSLNVDKNRLEEHG